MVNLAPTPRLRDLARASLGAAYKSRTAPTVRTMNLDPNRFAKAQVRQLQNRDMLAHAGTSAGLQAANFLQNQQEAEERRLDASDRNALDWARLDREKQADDRKYQTQLLTTQMRTGASTANNDADNRTSMFNTLARGRFQTGIADMNNQARFDLADKNNQVRQQIAGMIDQTRRDIAAARDYTSKYNVWQRGNYPRSAFADENGVVNEDAYQEYKREHDALKPQPMSLAPGAPAMAPAAGAPAVSAQPRLAPTAAPQPALAPRSATPATMTPAATPTQRLVNNGWWTNVAKPSKDDVESYLTPQGAMVPRMPDVAPTLPETPYEQENPDWLPQQLARGSAMTADDVYGQQAQPVSLAPRRNIVGKFNTSPPVRDVAPGQDNLLGYLQENANEEPLAWRNNLTAEAPRPIDIQNPIPDDQPIPRPVQGPVPTPIPEAPPVETPIYDRAQMAGQRRVTLSPSPLNVPRLVQNPSPDTPAPPYRERFTGPMQSINQAPEMTDETAQIMAAEQTLLAEGVPLAEIREGLADPQKRAVILEWLASRDPMAQYRQMQDERNRILTPKVRNRIAYETTEPYDNLNIPM